MCLYPKLRSNPKYKTIKKEDGILTIPIEKHSKTKTVSCRNCIECKSKKRDEYIRKLKSELETNKQKAYFITLTFSTEILNQFKESYEDLKLKESEIENKICKEALNKFSERWKRLYGSRPRHWGITERGTGTNNSIHIHAILWTNENTNNLEKIWKYGRVHIGKYVNDRTLHYITKSIINTNENQNEYKPFILSSKDIGTMYLENGERKETKNNNKVINIKNIHDKEVMTQLPISWKKRIYNNIIKGKTILSNRIQNIKKSFENNRENYERELQEDELKNNKFYKKIKRRIKNYERIIKIETLKKSA